MSDQENVPGSLIVVLGRTTVPSSITPSQQGAELPQGSQPQGAALQGLQGVPHSRW